MTNKNFSGKNLWVVLAGFFAFAAAHAATIVPPPTPAEQLEKGIELYNNHKDDEALDYFVDVMINGSREEMNLANRYLNLMHDRVGGIQKVSPEDLPVTVNEKGEVQGPWYAAESEQKALTEWVEDQRPPEQQTAQQPEVVAVTSEEKGWFAEGVDLTPGNVHDEPAWEGAPQKTREEETASAFVDLTSKEAIEARELYTAQKLASMREAAIHQINETSGLHLYMRDGKPDALDIEPDVLFDRKTFRADAQPVLNRIYELLALTSGSAYVILPKGSYTDDVTLASMRQAMALHSYLTSRGISEGKVSYNMGLVDKEAPARFANLHGLSIVFDYEGRLPTVLEKNEGGETGPLLSMAVVPLCHVLDRSLGEAVAVDFSVLETVNPLDNWVLQVVQHGHDGKYYVVRQLEGFAPVYHQILWNGRKGVIGPELPCGKYTFVLTATDLKGQKQTLRRRVVVKCSAQKKVAEDNACANCPEDCMLDYKAARLWSKPKRKFAVKRAAATVQVKKAAAAAEDASVSTATRTVNNTTIIEEYDPLTDKAAAAAGAVSSSSSSSSSSYSSSSTEELPINNPYDMPYEDFEN